MSRSYPPEEVARYYRPVPHDGGWAVQVVASGELLTWEEMITALQTWATAHGRAPHHGEWRAGTLEHPPTGTVKYVFGNWSAGLRAAGLQPAFRRWTEDEVLGGLRAYVRDHGRPPTTRNLRDTRGTPYPPASAFLRSLGSLRAALDRIGHHTAAPLPVTDDEILVALRAYALANPHPPTVAIWRTERRRPSASVIIRRHGSWKAALTAALADVRGPEKARERSGRSHGDRHVVAAVLERVRATARNR